ncbi:MAG: class II aldolase/adducin family protein [Thermoplasmata archaeon]
MNVKNEIIKYGRILFEMGLTESSHSGNISVRHGNKIFIKKHGTMMGSLSEDDIVEISFVDQKNYDIASSEVYSHVEIYKNTESNAIIHAHTIYAIVLSISENTDRIVPVDAEGKYYLKYIPVIDIENPVASKELAMSLGYVMKEHKMAVVKGHGTFARGKDLGEALKNLTLVESISKIIYLNKVYKNSL